MTSLDPCQIDTIQEEDAVEEEDKIFFLLNKDAVDAEMETLPFQE